MANFTLPTANTPKGKDEIEWSMIDTASLPKALGAKYTELRTIISALAKAKENFESEFSTACNIDEGYRMIFSYRFDNLSCGVVPEKDKTSKGKVAFGSLAKKGK